MRIFEDKYLTGEDLNMCKWLTAEINKQLDSSVQEILEQMPYKPDPEELNLIAKCALQVVLKHMPARLQLMKSYLLTCHIVGRLAEDAEADPGNELLQLRHDAEQGMRLALGRYMIETEVSDDTPGCDCEACQANRAAAKEGKRPQFGVGSATVQMRKGDEPKTGAFMVPQDEYAKGDFSGAMEAQVTNAFRCKKCKAITPSDITCSCGGTEFSPVAIVDIPIEELEAAEEIKKAEIDFGFSVASSEKKVMH